MMKVSVAAGRHLDELADERRHQTGLLGHPDADHGDEHDGDDGEAGEVVDERREQEPDPVRAQEAVDLGGLLVDLEVVVVRARPAG